MTVLRERFTHPGAPGLEARNPFTVDGDMVTMELTGGHVTTIDLADLPLAAPLRWSTLKSGNTFYAIANTPAQTKSRRTIARLHRLILRLRDPQTLADHVNGNGLDNRRDNLRACTHSENTRNCSRNSWNKSGFKGVSWCKSSGKYRAYIQPGKHFKCLGRFPTAEEAARAYDAAALKQFGGFARLNFPPPPG